MVNALVNVRVRGQVQEIPRHGGCTYDTNIYPRDMCCLILSE
jgi:hypothetical protein